ncbi:hypothetical protein ACH5RR_018881 [Cinchona calisaya]|uniref:Nucleolar pre-ribosomal-associated protein 1 n=1 Tax=Cinchona calisaya TaxID=153742 RepID=A0ABD2ZQI3_9GENT
MTEFVNKASHQAKIKELLRNLTSAQSKLSSDASKEFIKILKSDSGPEFVSSFIQSSPKSVELLQAWELRKGKPGFSHFLKLISAIFRYPFGNIVSNGFSGSNFVNSCLDKFARVIIEEKTGDLYKELSSKEPKRQKAVLLLLASIVRRGPGLAWEVAKGFDFKLGGFPKLAEWKVRRNEGPRRFLTRKEFVGFAMSFLEVGNPRLLRGILQQKDMYSGVLRGLGNDDEEIVVYVLLTLRDRVLVPESLVPPGLRSVLFGSATLEQLISISGWEDGGFAAELAHTVLIMVCTDPSNGLMPDLERQPSPLKGNVKRLLDLMKKLKATAVEHHKQLLLAIIKGKPAFGSAYLDEFPHNLEDLASPNWFSAISLAADVMSAVGDGLSIGFIDSRSQEPPSLGNPIVRDIIKCIGPRPFSRLVINKGLLHSDPLVKHVTLRLLLEELKLLDFLIGTLNNLSSSSGQMMHKWESLKRDVQNVVQIVLPDPQVLLSLLSALNGYCKCRASSMKRPADMDVKVEQNLHKRKRKKLKMNTEYKDTDILVSGVSSLPENDKVSKEDVENQLNGGADLLKPVLEIWGLHGCSNVDIRTEDGDTYFYSKLLEVLKIYQRTLPTAVEGSFDFFKVLPSNPLALPTVLQQSMLSLLIEQVGSCKSEIFIRTQPLMYKYLHIFINLFMYSPIRDIKDQAYSLAQAAMLSTGAFDRNTREISAWFLFIPGYTRDGRDVQNHEIEAFQNLSSVVTSFLCDAISTTGNNLFKYLDLLRGYICDLEVSTDISPNISPFVVCVLEKCLRLLCSESGSFTLPEKSMISMYVSTTLKYLMETQVEGGLLCSLIHLLISERLEGCCHMIGFCPCERRPLNSLLCLSRNIMHQEIYSSFRSERKVTCVSGSFSETLREVEVVLRSENHCGLLGVIMGFSFSMMCTIPGQILENFPSTISISTKLLGVPFSILFLMFFLEPIHFAEIFKLWPEVCFAGVEKVITGVHDGGEKTATNELDDSLESASIAFSLFIKQAPFHVLFPAIFFIDSSYLLEHSKVQDLLLSRLPERTPDLSISSFCHVLFYLFQARLTYRIKPFAELEKLCESSCFLAKHIVKQLCDEKINSSPRVWVPLSSGHVREVAEIILHHPLVTALLECPLPADNDVTDVIFMEPTETFLQFAERGVSKIDHHILNLLRTTSELLVHLLSDCRYPSEVDHSDKQTAKAFKALVQKLFVTFKERFAHCIKTKDLMPIIPTLYALHSLSEFICPFELLKLVQWLFSRIDLNDTSVSVSCQRCCLSVGLQIASWAFDSLAVYMLQSHAKRILFDLFMSTGNRSFDVTLFERMFFHIFEIATRIELDVADICLLKAVTVLKSHKHMEKTSLPFVMATSRLLASIPVNFLSYCMHKTTKTKSKLLFLLSEMSSLHLCVFGHFLSDKMSNDQAFKARKEGENCNSPQDDDEFLMLLPTVILYLNSTFLKFGGQLSNHVENVTSFFWKILLHGFSNWESFVLKELFEVKLECLPCSMEEFLKILSSSLLGKAVSLMRLYLAISGHLVKMKRRLSLFGSVCPCTSAHDDLLDCDTSDIGSWSLELSLSFANKITAKICFCRMLLFPEHNQLQSLLKDGKKKGIESAVSSSRIQFLFMLVHSWQHLVEKFHTYIGDPRQGDNTSSSLFRFLEIFILKNILELVREMQDCLVELHSLPLFDQLAKFCLLHRFEDPTTMKMLRTVLTSLPDGKFSCISILQLLLAHSQFAQTILFAHSSSVCTQFGMSFTPAHSIMRSLTFPRTEENGVDRKYNLHGTGPHVKKLELVKLLRVLIHIMGQQHDFNSETSSGINLKELVLVLLSSYGATVDEIDSEIYNLVNEIEAIDRSVTESIAKMDFLWGSASLKVRKEKEQEPDVSSSNSYDNEVAEERRRIQFRENFPIDPKLCAKTVLYFPYDRFANGSLSKLRTDDSDEGYSANSKKMQVYDPVFILRFSIHSLAMEYIEPLEFASLGLLAVTFISLSSPDADTRKLGYEAVVRFKSAVEKCQKRKDVVRLRLLLSYLQNGIEEECQRISSITAVFIAEASFVLLDSSLDHYSAISKSLMRSSGANMKGIPMFEEFFWSNSVTFKSERLWMLRLLNTALNMDDDAQILVRNSIFEILLNFYASPLSDDESKELIIEMVKKSIKINKLAWHLVVHCGIIPWLSSLVASFYGSLLKDKRSFSFAKLAVVLEAANDLVLSRNTSEWLQKYALEQLSELAAHVYQILVGCTKLIQEHTRITDLILQLLMSTLKISQKRKIYQPHFKLSLEGLYQLYDAVDACPGGSFSSTSEIGLKAILMSTPPVSVLHMDQNKLLKFVSWAISTAVQSNLTKVPEPEAGCSNFSKFSEEQSEEDILSKLLRWLTASVILGMLSLKLSNLNYTTSSEILKLNNLQSILECCEKGFGGNQEGFGREEILALSIFYLQQLVGLKWKLLPSVVSALSLLLFSGPLSADSDSLCGDGGIPWVLLCRKIHSPAEANPSWRWSFYQPWRDLSLERAEVEKLEEIHACQKLMVLILKKLGNKSLFSQFLSPQEVENLDVFEWERSILQSHG